jgi:hypothetical protein
MLTNEQYALLKEESSRTGRSLAELVRSALDERSGGLSNRERLRLLEDSFGAWRGHEEDGAAFVERVRTGTVRRLGKRS